MTLDRLAQVQAELEHVTELNVELTERPGHATELASAAVDDGFEAIVVYSGDGVFNEALNGLTRDVPVGFLPGGGTSVLSRALGMPHDPVAAAKRLGQSMQAQSMRRITVGRVNGRRFAFAAGIGLDAEAVRRVDRMGRTDDGKRPGDFAFARAVISELAKHTGHMEPALEVKGYGRAAFVFVANGSPYTYARGVPLPIVPEAEFELGLDMVAPVRVRRRSVVRTAYELLSGHPRLGKALYAHDVDRLEVVCDVPTPLQADGEDLGDVREAVFEAERGAVAVLA